MKLTRKERILISFSVKPEYKHILDQFDKLVAIERPRGGRSALLLRAMKEYLDHHWPGNPQQTFVLPSPADPHRDKAAINFLRHRVRLPIRQIAKIVGRSIPYVQKACGVTEFRGERIAPKTVRLFKERFRGFMEGRYKTPKEAFEVS